MSGLWRDPDPVRRWAAGQAVRRWWRLPMATPVICIVLITLQQFGILYYVAKTNPSTFLWSSLEEATTLLLSLSLLISLAVGSLIVAVSPLIEFSASVEFLS